MAQDSISSSHSQLSNVQIDSLLHSAALTMEEMIIEISNPQMKTSNFTIDYFIENIVTRQFPQYKMQLTQYTQFPHRYKSAPHSYDDIQIIYAVTITLLAILVQIAKVYLFTTAFIIVDL